MAANMVGIVVVVGDMVALSRCRALSACVPIYLSLMHAKELHASVCVVTLSI